MDSFQGLGKSDVHIYTVWTTALYTSRWSLEIRFIRTACSSSVEPLYFHASWHFRYVSFWSILPLCLIPWAIQLIISMLSFSLRNSEGPTVWLWYGLWARPHLSFSSGKQYSCIGWLCSSKFLPRGMGACQLWYLSFSYRFLDTIRRDRSEAAFWGGDISAFVKSANLLLLRPLWVASTFSIFNSQLPKIPANKSLWQWRNSHQASTITTIVRMIHQLVIAHLDHTRVARPVPFLRLPNGNWSNSWKLR